MVRILKYIGNRFCVGISLACLLASAVCLVAIDLSNALMAQDPVQDAECIYTTVPFEEGACACGGTVNENSCAAANVDYNEPDHVRDFFCQAPNGGFVCTPDTIPCGNARACNRMCNQPGERECVQVLPPGEATPCTGTTGSCEDTNGKSGPHLGDMPAQDPY
jgi:hypothetical protein